MSVHELFYQSALINALIFFWLAAIVSSVRALSRSGHQLSSSLVLSVLLGPLALVGAYVYGSKAKTLKTAVKKPSVSSAIRSFVSIVGAAALLAALFYYLFVFDFNVVTTSSDWLLRNIFLYLVMAGFILGLALAAITKRIAFFESSWAVCITAFAALLLQRWADEIFAYGTSVAYFVTLFVAATTLLLIFLALGGSIGYLIFGEGRFNLNFGYENFIGFRFLMTKRSSQVVSLITVISIVAVMIACTGMIVVMSVMNGFSSDLRQKILGANAHLMLLKYGKDFNEYPQILKKTKNIPGVASASAFVVNEGMVSSNKNLSGAIITGIDIENIDDAGRLKYVSAETLAYLKNPDTIPVVTELSKNGDMAALEKESKKNELPGVILGKEMAQDLQVMVGDIVNFISPVGEMGPTGPIPKAKPFRLAGLFYSGMYDFDSKFAYILLKDAQSFFNLGLSVTGIEYRVLDIEKTRVLAKEIESIIGGYPFYTKDWMQMNRNMFSALQLEKIAMLIILATLIFMASLLILVTLIMVVMEKGKEIAILKSMGATDVSIMKIFVTYGLFVGGLGALSGGMLGYTVCFLVEKIGIRLDPDVYYFSNIPVKIETMEVLLVVGAAILISFLATIPPSLFAARLKPVEGLRYE